MSPKRRFNASSLKRRPVKTSDTDDTEDPENDSLSKTLKTSKKSYGGLRARKTNRKKETSIIIDDKESEEREDKVTQSSNTRKRYGSSRFKINKKLDQAPKEHTEKENDSTAATQERLDNSKMSKAQVLGSRRNYSLVTKNKSDEHLENSKQSDNDKYITIKRKNINDESYASKKPKLMKKKKVQRKTGAKASEITNVKPHSTVEKNESKIVLKKGARGMNKMKVLKSSAIKQSASPELKSNKIETQSNHTVDDKMKQILKKKYKQSLVQPFSDKDEGKSSTFLKSKRPRTHIKKKGKEPLENTKIPISRSRNRSSKAKKDSNYPANTTRRNSKDIINKGRMKNFRRRPVVDPRTSSLNTDDDQSEGSGFEIEEDQYAHVSIKHLPSRKKPFLPAQSRRISLSSTSTTENYADLKTRNNLKGKLKNSTGDAVRIRKLKGASLSNQHFLRVEKKRRRTKVPSKTTKETPRSYSGRKITDPLAISKEVQTGAASIRKNNVSNNKKRLRVRQNTHITQNASQNSSQRNNSRTERKNNSVGLGNTNRFKADYSRNNKTFKKQVHIENENSLSKEANDTDIFFDLRNLENIRKASTVHSEEKEKKFNGRTKSLSQIKVEDNNKKIDSNSYVSAPNQLIEEKFKQENEMNWTFDKSEHNLNRENYIEHGDIKPKVGQSLQSRRRRINLGNKKKVMKNGDSNIKQPDEGVSNESEEEFTHALVAQIRNGYNPYDQRQKRTEKKDQLLHKKRTRLSKGKTGEVKEKADNHKVNERQSPKNPIALKERRIQTTEKLHKNRQQIRISQQNIEKSPSFTFFYNETTRNTRPTPNLSLDDISDDLPEIEDTIDFSDYVDKAINHAQITWSQDPFRASESNEERPVFDIDYTKDPNLEGQKAANSDFRIKVLS